MGAAENTTKDSRCERQGKKAEGNKEGGLGLRKTVSRVIFFYDTHLPQECSINMVISPAGNRKCWRLEVIFCTCCHKSGWAGWRSPVEWLGVLLRGSTGNGSQASLKSHFLLTKRVVLGWGWDGPSWRWSVNGKEGSRVQNIYMHILPIIDGRSGWKNLKFYISFLIFYCLLSRKLLWPKPNLTLLNSLASRCSRMSGGALISSASFCCQMNGWILFCHFKFPSEIAPLTPHSAQVAFRHHWRVL